MKKALYQILPEKRLILEFYAGQFTWDDIIEFKKKELLDPNYSSKFNIIVDARSLDMGVEELDNVNKYMDFVHENPEMIGIRNTAIMTSNPSQVIHAELLRYAKQGLPIRIKTVSTVEAALKWVQLPKNEEKEVDECLEEFAVISKKNKTSFQSENHMSVFAHL